MFKEFKDFTLRGNVLDLAVAFIMGAAFGRIVTSLVNDIVMPPIGLLLGRVNFASLYWNISGTAYTTLADAQKAGAATINYGAFINIIINFLIVAAVMFFMVKASNKLTKPAKAPDKTTKDCPYCLSAIPLKAKRCSYCTSELK